MSVAISIKNVSKIYNIYEKPSDRIKELFHPFKSKYHRTFTALHDISLDIHMGETVGIVGRNGCGKSTLLQLVCNIMPPTSGTIEVFGRISSILELGAGFNPEFSGIDNIYLNCSILGMSRREAEDKIDDILGFADIGEFVKQPVKNYSSGMTVRLAFAIAINVDPSILVVDEALSVGDAAFQRKCFSRIHEIKEDGATILFVSHDANAVVELCQRAVLLDSGEQLFCGDPKKTISYYHKLLFASPEKTRAIRKSILSSVRSESVDVSSDKKDRDSFSEEKKQFIRSSYNPHMQPKSTLWYEPAGAIISNPGIFTSEGKRVNCLLRNESYFYSYGPLDAWRAQRHLLPRAGYGADRGPGRL